MRPESLLHTCKNREKAIKYLIFGFWAKWGTTTFLGFIFLIRIIPCILSQNNDHSIWSLILAQTGITIAVFFIVYRIFSFLLEKIRTGQTWALHLWTLYIAYALFRLCLESMGYTPSINQAIDITEVFLTNHVCDNTQFLQLYFRIAIAIVVACLCISSYGCFILLHYPIIIDKMGNAQSPLPNENSESSDRSSKEAEHLGE